MNCKTCGVKMNPVMGFWFCECGNGYDPIQKFWIDQGDEE
jgi:hypothetical protein